MSETMFSPIRREGTGETGRLGPRRSEEAKSSRGASAEPASRRRSGSPLADVSLHFEIDEQTQDVTIIMVDRSTDRVIRTIPPDELRKLTAGSLVELFT